MEIILLLLLIGIGLGSLACWIITLVRIFQSDNGIVHGIIGIICSLWAFIYGWMKADEMGNRQVMIIWTILIIAGIALNILTSVMLAGSGSY